MSTLFDFISIAIGLVFIFWLLSIITSYVLELISSTFALRAHNLADAIHLMLQPPSDKLNGVIDIKKTWLDGQAIWDKGVSKEAGTAYSDFVSTKVNENLLKAFYSHPLVAALSKPKTLPSYIDPATFSTVILDLFAKAGADEAKAPGEYMESVKIGLQQIDNLALKSAVMPLIENAERMEVDSAKRILMLKSSLEDWFNGTMDRASGWYKRRATLITIVVGIVIAVAINADSIGIAQALWRDGVLRQSIATAASPIIQDALTNKKTDTDQAFANLSALNIPLGWSGRLASMAPSAVPNPQDFPIRLGDILSKLMGLAITSLAISLGSSIWFDALQKLINLRSSVVKPENT